MPLSNAERQARKYARRKAEREDLLQKAELLDGMKLLAALNKGKLEKILRWKRFAATEEGETLRSVLSILDTLIAL